MLRATQLTIFLCSLLLSALVPSAASAQDAPVAQPETYKFSLGASVGMTGYLGDANETSLFGKPGFGGNISFRYLANTRWALHAIVGMSSLSGSTADMENVLPGIEPFDFKSTVYDAQCRYELNFFNYGIGEGYKRLMRFTPYIAAGLGISVASNSSGSAAALSLPIAAGVKYKLRERLNLSLEFSMTKLFGDKADDARLADPYMIKSSFLKNTDWYSALLISISYEFGKRCVACNRQD